MYLRGALDSAHFHHMRKVTIQLLHAQEKNLCMNKSLLRPLMLGSLARWSMMPWDLMP
jgi:hypothetical protein